MSHSMRFALLLLACGSCAAGEPLTLRVMTFNVWYGGEQVSIAKVGEAIRKADADIVGVQESDANLARIAEVAGMPYVDTRRRIISRWPIFDSGSGMRTDRDVAPYSITALDQDAIHAWVMVRPGKVVAVSNVHLSSDPSGLEMARTGSRLDEVMKLENGSRALEARPLAALGRLAAGGTPVFLTGDFNTPSHLDWTAAADEARDDIPYAVQWPAMRLLADAGLRDSYREAHPDPVARQGNTWTPGTPHPVPYNAPGRDRIDFILVGGNAKTTRSQLVGEEGGPDVDLAVMPWPSDHRAVVSTFSVSPVAAPPLIAATPRVVRHGGNILLRAHDPTGDAWTGLITRRGGAPNEAITGVMKLPSTYQLAMPFSTRELAPGEYDALLVGATGNVLKRSAFTVVQSIPAPSVTAVAAQLRPGTPVRAKWSDAPGDLRDWIAVYRRGEVDVTRYLGFAYTDAAAAGETLVRPEGEPGWPAGEYELRLMHDETYVALASAPFSVRP